jgi:hypothetical protein
MAQSWTTKIRESPVDELAKFRKQLPASGGRKLVVILAGKGKALIQARTVQGIGAGNRPFTPYSKKTYYAPVERRPPGYKKPTGGRTEHAVTGKPLKTVAYDGGYGQYKAAYGLGSRPTLSVSNKMLAAISIAEVSAKTAILYFHGREEAAKAHGHHFGTTVPKREFFDLSDFKNRKELQTELVKQVRQMAKKARLELDRRSG